MLPLRYGKLWLALGWLMVLVTLGAFVAPAPEVLFVSHIDKVQHFLCFFVLTVWFCGLYDRRRYALVALGLILYAAGSEVIQGFLSYRTASLGDLVADAAGVVAGIMASARGAGRWCIELERHLPS